jgi:hypothetical protein
MSRVLRQAFLDVCNGYSVADHRGKKIYIKHLSHKEHLMLDDLQESFKKDAINSGIPSEKEKINYLISEGLWSEKREIEIAQKRRYIQQMNDGKKKMNLPSMLERHIADIKKEEAVLRKWENERYDLIGITCESYASKVVSDYYVLRSFFKDKLLTTPYLTEAEFDEVDDTELISLINIYKAASDICSEQNLKSLAIQDFYTPYFYLCDDNIMSFFGKPICDLSYNQIKLASLSRYFKSIMDGVDLKTLPKKALEDPDELINYITSTKNAKELVNRNDHANVAIVGATKQDVIAVKGEETQNALPDRPMNMRELFEMQQKNARC